MSISNNAQTLGVPWKCKCDLLEFKRFKGKLYTELE
jgi:hypothetical protein